MNYNKEQLEAINHKDGAVMVIAAAGSGKTTVLTQHIKKLVDEDKISQKEILAISFTNASATELKNRLKNMNIENVKVGTFHKIAADILGLCGFKNLHNQVNIFEAEKYIAKNTGEYSLNIEDIISFISYQKSYMVGYNGTFKEKASNYSEIQLRRYYKLYEEYKKLNNSYDFDDWLLLAYAICKKYPDKFQWDYVLADECQDENKIQYKLMKMWSRYDNIFAVGDIRQSIYGFNGAEPKLFMEFPDKIPNTKVINMNTNYRSCNNIVKYADDFIKPYFKDYKHYVSSVAYNQNNGSVITNIHCDETEQCAQIAENIQDLLNKGEKPEQITVLYRNNSQSMIMEKTLKDLGIDCYAYNNNSFFDKREIKGIISILRLLDSYKNNEAMDYILTKYKVTPLKFISKNTIQDIKQWSNKHNVGLHKAMRDFRCSNSRQYALVSNFLYMLDKWKKKISSGTKLDKIIEDIVIYLNVEDFIRENHNVEDARDRIESLKSLGRMARNNQLKSFIEYVDNSKNSNKKPKEGVVQLMTIHKSKGLEFDNVFIIGLEDKKFPSERTEIIDEAMLMYVAITRAKKYLNINSINSSRFFTEYCKNIKK